MKVAKQLSDVLQWVIKTSLACNVTHELNRKTLSLKPKLFNTHFSRFISRTLFYVYRSTMKSWLGHISLPNGEHGPELTVMRLSGLTRAGLNPGPLQQINSFVLCQFNKDTLALIATFINNNV